MEVRPYRRSVALVVLAVLLLAMATGQLADVRSFDRILGDYRVFGGATALAAALLIAGELFAGIGLLLRRRLPGRVVVAAALTGAAVTVVWSALAVQAFARGIALDNCGCFGVYLAQELRWWILLDDAEFLLLAVMAARAVGLRGRVAFWRGVEVVPSEGEEAPDRGLLDRLLGV